MPGRRGRRNPNKDTQRRDRWQVIQAGLPLPPKPPEPKRKEKGKGEEREESPPRRLGGVTVAGGIRLQSVAPRLPLRVNKAWLRRNNLPEDIDSRDPPEGEQGVSLCTVLPERRGRGKRGREREEEKEEQQREKEKTLEKALGEEGKRKDLRHGVRSRRHLERR
eukprot:12414513-Karenia_brevis.AAC.1